MELLVKEFQKQIQAEKQEFARRLEEYKRAFLGNLEVVRRESGELLAYQGSLRYYNNPNNFTLKLISESERRSQEWLLTQKRVLLRLSQALENPAFSANLSLLLGRANKGNLLMMPNWKGEKRDSDLEKECHNCIRAAVSNWVDFPEPVDL